MLQKMEHRGLLFWARLLPSMAAVLGTLSCGDDGITTPATGTIYVQLSGGTGTLNGDYAITLDGGSPLTLPLGSGPVTLSDVPAGSHLIELIGIPFGCGAGPDNPRTVNVSAEHPANVFFNVACQYPPPGTIQVTATSSGPAPASYNVLIDSFVAGTVVANGTQNFNISAGSRGVALANVPANCDQEPKYQQVEVVYADTVTVSFTVICTSAAIN
jgi:hypothetical protein